MKKNLILLSLFLALLSCGKKSSTPEQADLNDSLALEAVTAAIDDSIDHAGEEKEGEDFDPESENELRYIVSIAEGYQYDSLKNIALEASKVLGYKFDTLGRYYNPQKKSIIVPENDEDEIWAGSYFLRRSGGESVSLEMRAAYIDTLIANNEALLEAMDRDSTRMFVCADLMSNKQEAESLQQVLLKQFPQTKIIAAKIYMGCMH